MELRHLRYFVVVAREENITRAARKLHVSQPALSRQIQDLEAELGLALLERTAKSVRLTEVGRVFQAEAQTVLDRVQEGVDKAKATARAPQHNLHVGYAPSPSVEILPRALRAFQTRHPGVRVVLHDLSAEEMVAQLHEAKLDLALTVRPSGKTSRGLKFQELARYPLCLAMPPSHPLARLRAVSISAVLAQSLLGYTRGEYPDYYIQIEKLFPAGSPQPRFTGEHDSVTSLIAGVEAGHGVSILPSCVSIIAGSRLKLVPIKPAGPPLIVGVLLGEKVTPLALEFVTAATAANTSVT